MASVAASAVEEKLDLPFPQYPEFRSHMRARRREVGTSEACETASAVKNILLAEPAIRNASNIAAYSATDGEVDVSDVARWAQKAGKRVFFPAMREDSIAFVEWLPDADWTEGAFAIPEPAGGKEIAIENCDAALVPGVAFGKDGSRIGRGKGYYDRALAFLAEGQRPRPPVLFGICHDFQIIKGLEQPSSAGRGKTGTNKTGRDKTGRGKTGKDTDIPMDAVVSPAGIHWRR